MKFNKDYNLNIVSLLVAVIFLLNSTVYGMDLSNNKAHIRIPVGQKSTYDRMHEEIEAEFQKESLPLFSAATTALDKYKALEMGAGLGYFFKQLLSLHPDWDIIAIDNNKYAIAETKERYGLEIKDMDARNTVFADNTFNLVIINYPIFSNGILMNEFIEEAYRILRDGGRIEIVTEAPEKGDVLGIPAIRDLLYKSGFSSIEVSLRPEDYLSSNFDYVELDPNNTHRHLDIRLVVGYKENFSNKNWGSSNLSNGSDMTEQGQGMGEEYEVEQLEATLSAVDLTRSLTLHSL